ncbi:MAG TPA: glycosyltransferase [Patescibacteria group bacterium]|nr:glycosyltransferase [Patescibacteria group bacterium]
MKSFLLSVVIPSYNEIANLHKGTLNKVQHFLEKRQYDYEVIVVDDGSSDGSREFVRRFSEENSKFKLIENNHMGKAGAVTTGVLKASGDYILFTDMDQATPIEEIEKLLPFATDGYDIIIGSRSTSRKGSPMVRVLISRSSIILRKVIVGLRDIVDTQCGFKLFSKAAAHEIFKKVYDMHHGYKSIKRSSVASGFDIELLYIGTVLGYKIKEVPVDWLYVESRRVNPINDSINGFFDLLRIRSNIKKGLYSK